MSGVALDHVGVVSRDLPALVAQYEQLGFNLTPLARQSDGRIGNRCAMLRHGYVELLAVVDPNASSATLDRFLARYAGIHILAFGMDDPQATLARLRRAGVDTPTLAQSERAIDDANPTGARARFAIVSLPDQAEGRINLVRHLTPEALWRERFLRHPNRAVGLNEVVLAVADPAETAARFSRLVGCVVVPDPSGGFALDLTHGCVRVLSDAALHTVLPGVDPPTLPCIVGLTITTSDGNRAVSRLLTERHITHCSSGDSLLVAPACAGGVAVCFAAGAI